MAGEGRGARVGGDPGAGLRMVARSWREEAARAGGGVVRPREGRNEQHQDSGHLWLITDRLMHDQREFGRERSDRKNLEVARHALTHS